MHADTNLHHRPHWQLPKYQLPVPKIWTTLVMEISLAQHSLTQSYSNTVLHKAIDTVKPVYNDHLMGYFSAFWSSSR